MSYEHNQQLITTLKTKQGDTPKHQDSTTGQGYTCTMHPEVVTSNPGKCPKCGMELVPVKTEETTKKMGDMKM